MPVAYLTGEKEFFSLKFTVTRDVLVPRPETEGLVEAALAYLKDVEQPTFADVGTGSGCVAIAVLYRVPAARGFASDTSAAALGVAKANAARLGVADRFDAREGCLLAPLRNEPAFGRLDAVLSNPPYVVRGDPSLARGVADHEPAAALYVDGDDSLVLARALAREALEALRTGGLLAIEIGHRDGAAAKSMLEESGYRDVAVDSDLGGIPRVVKGRRP